MHHIFCGDINHFIQAIALNKAQQILLKFPHRNDWSIKITQIMEPQENTVEAIAEDSAETGEANTATKPTEVLATKQPEAEEAKAPAPLDDTIKLSSDLWKQVQQFWENYFGEGKQSNLTLLLTIITTIPVLIAASTLVDFLDKLPLLPSIFELVGFVYSVWFIYRYLLLASTRKELIDGIVAWKNKVFG
jgi:hypothetical protein